MPICTVGDPQDLAAVYIRWLAGQKGDLAIELNEDQLGAQWTFQFDDKRAGEGWLEIEEARYQLTEVTGAFIRLNPHPGLPAGLELDAAKEQRFISERRAGLHHFLQCLPGAVVNRPSAGRSNGSKPYQMRLLEKAGFDVPRWVVTNDAEKAREFAATCRSGAIYKSCSGLRSQVRRLDAAVLETLEQGSTPMVVQEYIPGADVRVHTVKQTAFPTEIVASGVDYRFEHEDCKYRATSMPEALSELCCRASAQEGLVIGGFDFRVTAAGAWLCLEVNPVPSFLPYEMQTGQPIGQAVLDVMTGA